MEVLGLKLNVASDDMFVPALFGLGKSVAGFVASIVAGLVLSQGALIDASEECLKPATPAEKSGAAAAWVLMVLFIFCFATFAAIFRVSAQGTPCEPEQRKAMPNLIVAMALLYVAEIALGVWASLLASSWPHDEDDEACGEMLEQKLVAVGVGAAFIWLDVVFFFIWSYLFQHRYSLSVTDLLAAMILIRADQKAVQAGVLRFSRYESPDSEFVPGAKSRKKKFGVVESSVRSMTAAAAAAAATSAKVDAIDEAVPDARDRTRKEGDDDDDDEEREDVEAGMRRLVDPDPVETDGPPSEEAFKQFSKHYEFIPYMIALYGWKLVLYSSTVRLRPLTGISKVLKLPGLRKQATVRGDGDNCCGCAAQALLGETALDPESVIYATFSSVAIRRESSVQIPHAVMVDHEKRAVVVAMRGTLSLQDLMTDAMLEPASLGPAGNCWGFDGSRHHAHEGMLKVAMRIRGTLERNQVLHRLLGVAKRTYQRSYMMPENRAAVEPVVDIDLDALPDCSGYDLVVLGHSLGAGVASIVTLLLRPTFPQARCLAYAGPGCVFDYELAEASQEWCTNLFLGSDIVPRLSWEALMGLRERVFDVLYRAKASKARILRGALGNASAEALLYEPFEVPQTPGRLALKARAEEMSQRQRTQRADQIPMYAPGVLIHLAKVETVLHRGFFTRRKQRIYEPHWVLDRRALGDPLISTRSLLDHFPDLIPEACAQILERHGRDSSEGKVVNGLKTHKSYAPT
ncbi:Sn1-specific diacylglycerol lipase alpha [Hondaea fermentalgiana]|uniref:sn-1-specific diacylglycerol lipase n=1 Tax=Hondaea fermentalgiana TaxID=2315210 RepID=A0A2R5GB40_9STRA|nr:Sn1-specific diacylglycerol lipase alpha [Hondaea fermentalgiana]|eukprot:GBG27805.1 Sn1-specific diacylglycerol lipase alpha [Hondaea fermentalgiana]